MRIFLLLIMMMLIPEGVRAQNKYTGFPSLVWPKLYNTEFVKMTDEHGEYDKPIFSEPTKALAGKIITLPGYMVPFDSGNEGKVFMLSSLPLNACFFCGVGGPETAIEVRLKKPVTFSEKPIEVKGVLKLNDTDPDAMIYILEQAEVTGIVQF